MIRKLILTLLLASMLCILWGAWMVVGTTSGLRLDIAIATRFLPGALSVQQVEGSLLRGFTLRGIRYQYADWDIDAGIPSLTLSWQGWTSQLKGEWQLNASDIGHVSDVLKGALHGRGGIHGGLLDPCLVGIVNGKALSISGQDIGNPTAHLIFSLHRDLKIQGYLELTSQIESLPPLITPWVKNPSGRLTLELSLGGLLLDPAITGKARLSDASLHIPATGMHPEHINLSAHLESNGNIPFDGTFMSGKGSGSIKGMIQGTTVTLDLRGNALQAANLSHWQVTLSPDLQLKITPQQFEAKGAIQIPEALITSSDINNTITLADDVVIVSASGKAPTLPFQTSFDLTIHLGDDIRIATENLQTTLKGNLHLQQWQSGPFTGTGDLAIARGKNTFKAYGQTLNILSGRLFFTGGPLTNPGLAITAAKTIQTISMSQGTSSFTNSTGLQPVYTGREKLTVGVHVSGTLNDPILRLFSEPPMGQADMLSYLIFGYPRSEISGQQTSVLLTALSALTPGGSLAGGTDITDLLQKKLGITELNLETAQFFNPSTSSTVSTTALVIGRKLSDKLSLHYSISLFYPVSILNLRYQFNKHWALQSENSTIDNGADLLFGIERD